MSFMDKLKGLVKGRETQVKQGIDKGSDAVESRVGTKHAGKVEDASERAKDMIDKQSGSDARPTSTSSTPPSSSTSTPPASTPPTTPPSDTP